MKPIDHNFIANGFNHELIERGGMVCIFRRWKGECVPHFEVVILQEQKETKRSFDSGQSFVRYPAQERYPCAEQWGAKGWTFNTMEAAQNKFSELVAARQLT